MPFVKKILILSGVSSEFSAVKGMVNIESSAAGNKCTLNMYNLADLAYGEYAFGLQSEGAKLVRTRLGRAGKISITFSIDPSMDLSGKLHACVAHINADKITPITFGANSNLKIGDCGIVEDMRPRTDLRSAYRTEAKDGSVTAVGQGADSARAVGTAQTVTAGTAKQANRDAGYFIETPRKIQAGTPKSAEAAKSISDILADLEIADGGVPLERVSREGGRAYTDSAALAQTESPLTREGERITTKHMERSADYVINIQPTAEQAQELRRQTNQDTYQITEQAPSARYADEAIAAENFYPSDLKVDADVWSPIVNAQNFEPQETLRNDVQTQETKHKKDEQKNERIISSDDTLAESENTAESTREFPYIASWGSYKRIQPRKHTADANTEAAAVSAVGTASAPFAGMVEASEMPSDNQKYIVGNQSVPPLQADAAAGVAEEIAVKMPPPMPYANYYLSVRENIEEIFRTYPPESILNANLKGTKWVKVPYGGSGQYYIVGLIGSDPDYIAYGVPGRFTVNPPKELADFCQWLPLNEREPEGAGYWMMYQDAASGGNVKLDIF